MIFLQSKSSIQTGELMKETWEDFFKVRAYDVDFKDRIKVSSIFNYMQDIASAHANDLHCGWEDLQKLDLLWVLSWIKVEFISLPHFEDEIKIKTWSKGRFKLYALRDFLLYDKKGLIFCKATSAWLLLNSSTKRITDIKNLRIDFPFQPNVHAIKDLPQKIKYESKRDLVSERMVSYSDIDINHHMNNAKYVEFLMNSYPLDFHNNNSLKSITMTFNSETKFGDIIEINVNENSGSNRLHYIEALNKESGKQVFQSIVNWDKT